MYDTTFIRLVSERCDPEEILDILGITSEELAIVYMKEVMEQKKAFMTFLDFEEFSNE